MDLDSGLHGLCPNSAHTHPKMPIATHINPQSKFETFFSFFCMILFDYIHVNKLDRGCRCYVLIVYCVQLLKRRHVMLMRCLKRRFNVGLWRRPSELFFLFWSGLAHEICNEGTRLVIMGLTSITPLLKRFIKWQLNWDTDLKVTGPLFSCPLHKWKRKKINRPLNLLLFIPQTSQNSFEINLYSN